MISERSKALLNAAATIYASQRLEEEAVRVAYALLALIERREKANAPKSTDLDCSDCGADTTRQNHHVQCPRRR